MLNKILVAYPRSQKMTQSKNRDKKGFNICENSVYNFMSKTVGFIIGNKSRLKQTSERATEL